VLIEHGLADEVMLLIYPVLLGTGKRFFSDGAPPRELALISACCPLQLGPFIICIHCSFKTKYRDDHACRNQRRNLGRDQMPSYAASDLIPLFQDKRKKAQEGSDHV
jgi:hypothetical protein